MPGVVDGALTIGGVAHATDRLQVSNAIGAIEQLRATLIDETQLLSLQAGPLAVTATARVGGSPLVVFTGQTAEQTPSVQGDAEEWTSDVTAEGRLALTNRALPQGTTYGPAVSVAPGVLSPSLYDVDPPSYLYASQYTDITLIRALLGLVGIVPAAGDILGAGASPTVGVAMLNRASLSVGRERGAVLAAIRRIDEATDCFTVDQPDGAVQRFPRPYAGTPTVAFAEGASGSEVPLLTPARWTERIGDYFDAAMALGYVYPEGDAVYYNRPNAGYKDGVPFDGAAYNWKKLQSDLLDTTALADLAATNLKKRYSRMPRGVVIEVEADRVYRVGALCSFRCPRLAFATAVAHVIAATDLTVTESSGIWRLTLEPLAPGAAGALTSLLPVPHASVGVSDGTVDGVHLNYADVAVAPISLVSDGPFDVTVETDARTKKGTGQGTAAAPFLFRFVFLDSELPATIRATATDPETRLRAFEDLGAGP